MNQYRATLGRNISLLDNISYGPSLSFTDGAAFNDSHFITNTTTVLGIMGHVFGTFPKVFSIGRMLCQPLDQNQNGLICPITHNRANQFSLLSTLCHHYLAYMPILFPGA
jgi:hypothetical protein